MESFVWAIFGVLAVLLALSIIFSLYSKSSDTQKLKVNSNALEEFKQYCDFVCNSEQDTRITKRIEISSGTFVFSKGKAICMKFKDWQKCASCLCDLNYFKTLDLNKKELLSAYKWHAFDCVFERVSLGVRIECFG